MQLQFIEKSSYQLLNYSPDISVILKIRGKPFLLVKTHSTFSDKTILVIKIGNLRYQATFLRHLNLAYAGKLSQLVQKVGSVPYPNFQNQWLAFFQLREFSQPSKLKYKVQIPPYGAQVIVNKQNGTKQLSRIANMYKYQGEAFYLLQQSSISQKGFDLITDIKKQKVYGITYPCKNILICIPMHSILSQKPCIVNIHSSIKPLLASTCYINYQGYYCTGIRLDQSTIISARHVIPFQEQKIGLQVGIRFYPYHQQVLGEITKMGQGSVDCLVIGLQKKIISKIKTSNIQEQKTIIFDKNYEDLIGKKLISLGFGKYAYSSNIFRKIEIIMPTIQTGIISKIIRLGHHSIFIKTDAALYNGFSGCALWNEDNLIGMAIFILKNKNGQANYNRHNFSYTISFILNLLKQNKSQQMISEINAELEYFDRIQTRHKITLFPKL